MANRSATQFRSRNSGCRSCVLHATPETRNPRRALVIALLWILTPGQTPSAPAQPLQKTVAMVGARSGASWPLWIAKDARLYAKYGLDVELVYAVHPGPIAAIISGHAAMTSSGSDPALLAAAKDPSLVVLGGFMNKGSFAMIGSRTASDMKQLGGKKNRYWSSRGSALSHGGEPIKKIRDDTARCSMGIHRRRRDGESGGFAERPD